MSVTHCRNWSPSPDMPNMAEMTSTGSRALNCLTRSNWSASTNPSISVSEQSVIMSR